MPDRDTAHDLDLLIRAAREAGEIAMRYFRKQPKVWDKGNGEGPVTEADLAVNEALARTLRPARPGYGWLSEESEDDPARLSARTVFILDPIDGTRAFIEGQDSFSHAIAVVTDGQVRAGVVYLPARDLLYAATADGPATLNGLTIRARETALPEGAEILMSRMTTEPGHWLRGAMPDLKRVFRPSIAWRLALVGEGRFDGALSFRPAWEWDIAAGSLIAARAGAEVSDAAGGALRFNQPRPMAAGLWAAPPALHAAVRRYFALRLP